MMKLMKRVALLKGPWHERMSLVALYSVCVAYLVIFYYFFSLEPGPASMVSDRMMRLTPFLGNYLFPSLAIACISWLTALGIAAFRLIKKCLNRMGSAIALLLAAPVAFILLREIYSVFLRGHGHTLHRWLYYNL